MDELIQEAPEEAWLTILEIVTQDNSSWNIENLGAGPLEDLLVYHGPVFIGRIEALADNPSVRALAQQAWKNDMTDQVWERLQSIAKRSA
jgi:hypothetical protein